MRTPERNCWSRSRAWKFVRPANGTTRSRRNWNASACKALAKRASERYTTAKDMADDLRHFLPSQSAATVAGG